MNDLKSVIHGLECRLDIDGSKYKHCLSCNYRHDIDHCEWACKEDDILKDALSMLKAQEPKPPLVTENAYGWKFYHCPSCGREFYGDRLPGRMDKTTFCDKCGQAVKWDG